MPLSGGNEVHEYSLVQVGVLLLSELEKRLK